MRPHKSPALALAIREAYAEGLSQSAIAARVGCSRVTVWRYLDPDGEIQSRRREGFGAEPPVSPDSQLRLPGL